jgi:hypothetical protein
LTGAHELFGLLGEGGLVVERGFVHRDLAMNGIDSFVKTFPTFDGSSNFTIVNTSSNRLNMETKIFKFLAFLKFLFLVFLYLFVVLVH